MKHSLYVINSWMISIINIFLQIALIYYLSEDIFVQLTIFIGLLSFLTFFDFGIGALSLHKNDLQALRTIYNVRLSILILVFVFITVAIKQELKITELIALITVAAANSLSLIAKNYFIGNEQLSKATVFNILSETSLLVMKVLILIGSQFIGSLIISIFTALLLIIYSVRQLTWTAPKTLISLKECIRLGKKTVSDGYKYFIPLAAWAIFLLELRSIYPARLSTEDAYYIVLAISLVMVASGLLIPIVNINVRTSEAITVLGITKRHVVIVSTTLASVLIVTILPYIAETIRYVIPNVANSDALVRNLYAVTALPLVSVINIFSCYRYKESINPTRGILYLSATTMKLFFFIYLGDYWIHKFKPEDLLLMSLTAQGIFLIILYDRVSAISIISFSTIISISISITLSPNFDFFKKISSLL